MAGPWRCGGCCDGGGAGGSTLLIKTITATPYVLTLDDAGYRLRLNTAAVGILTIPTFANVAFPLGTCFEFCNIGAGLWSFALQSPGTMTLRSPFQKVQLATVAAEAGLIIDAANDWSLEGDLA